MAMVWLVVMLGVLERAAPAEPGGRRRGRSAGTAACPTRSATRTTARTATRGRRSRAHATGGRRSSTRRASRRRTRAAYDALEAWARGYSEFKPRWDEFSTLRAEPADAGVHASRLRARRTPDGLREALAQKYDAEVRQKGLDMLNYEGMSSTATRPAQVLPPARAEPAHALAAPADPRGVARASRSRSARRTACASTRTARRSCATSTAPRRTSSRRSCTSTTTSTSRGRSRSRTTRATGTRSTSRPARCACTRAPRCTTRA